MKITVEVPEEVPDLDVWAFLVKCRDNFICQECGARGTSIELNAHHKSKAPKDTLKISSGVTLCYKCHAKAHNQNTEILKPVRTPRQASSIEFTISFSNVAKLLGVSVFSLHKFIEIETTKQEIVKQAAGRSILHKGHWKLLRKVFGKQQAVVNLKVIINEG